MIMYGRECVMSWELEGDLGPLEDEKDQDLQVEMAIGRMYNIREQVLDVAQANIRKAQKIQARSYNTKHCRNALEVGDKVWRKNPLWNTKQKSLKKGPKWYGPYEIAKRKAGGNGNYLLIALSGKTKGQVSKKAYPPTTSRGSSTETLRFLIVILNMDLTTRAVSQLHRRVVYHQKRVFQYLRKAISLVLSDADTVLYAYPDEDPSHALINNPICTLIKDPFHTLPKMTAHIPTCTSTLCEGDDVFLPDLTDTNTATQVHTERTLPAAEILADLADGGGVSGHDESAESLQLQLEVTTTSEQQAKDAEEVDVVNTQEVDVENTQYEDQTMETSDPDVIINGVEDLKPTAFHPFILYMTKQVATTVNLNVGRKHGLGLRVDALRYHGTGEL